MNKKTISMTAFLFLGISFCATAQYTETSTAYATLFFQNNQLCIKNNTWGKGSLTNFTNVIWTNLDASNAYNWDCGSSWSWPNSGGVKAYNEIVYGYAGGGVWTTSSKLPTWLGAGNNIYVDWYFSPMIDSTGGTPVFNTSIDVFLQQDNSGTSSAREAELMIWPYNSNMSPGTNYFQGTASVDGFSWNVYYNPSATDGSVVWKYVAFITPSNMTSVTKLNIKAFTDYMISKGWARSGQNIYAIEAGNEVGQGKGACTHSWFAVDFGNMLTNPSFEKTTGWSKIGTASSWGSVTSTNIYDGLAAGKIGLKSGLQQWFTGNVSAGQTYKFGGWGKLSGSGESGSLQIKAYNSSGTVIGTSTLTFTSTSYAYASQSYTLPTGATKFEVILWKDTGSQYFYADQLGLYLQ
jgi:hypothetical protein